MKRVTLSLVTLRTGEPGIRSGLNWGQRNNRDRDQAYIPIPVEHRGYFPARGQHFVCFTDDGRQLTLVVAQDEGKALHTPHDNSELGRYFRKRLGVPLGHFVARAHLDAYGRTDVDFCRISETTYHLDFGAP